MKDIKEVALRLTMQIKGNPQAEDIEFAEQILAELQRQGTDVSLKEAEPLAWMAREDFEKLLSIGGNFVTGRKTGDDDVALFARPQPKAATVPTFNGAGRYCMSEYDCIAAGIDFAAYERGISDAIEACYRISREAK